MKKFNKSIAYKTLPIESNGESFYMNSTQDFFKYKQVWQRARLKLRFRMILSKIIKASILNDTEILNSPLSAEELQATTYNQFQTLDIEDIPLFIFHPNHNCLKLWNTLIAVSMIYLCLIMPFILAFLSENLEYSYDIVDYFFSVLYFIDFLINCSTAYFSNSGELIYSRKQIVWQYFKTWMIVDVFAFFPFELFTNGSIGSHKGTSYLVKLARLPRLYRILKISKVVKFLKVSSRYGFIMKLQEILCLKHSIMRLAINVISIAICVHIAGCMWYFSAKIDDFNTDTWVFRYNYLDSSLSTLYITGLYWAMTTLSTVGYGDISAFTEIEMVFSMIWMVAGLYFLSFTIGSLSSFINSIGTKDRNLLKKLAIIDEFSSEAGLTKYMQLKLRDSLRRSSSISGYSFIEKSNIIAELPKALRYEVAMAMHRGASKYLYFFKDKDTVLITAIVPYLIPMYLTSSSYVYKYLDFSDELYFIVKGKAIYTLSQELITIYTIKHSDYFGDIELLLMIPRKYNAIAIQNTELLALNRDILKNLKKYYKSIWHELYGVAVERERALQKNIARIKSLKTERASQAIMMRFQFQHNLRKDMEFARLSSKKNTKIHISDISTEDKLQEVNARLTELKDLLKKNPKYKVKGYSSA